MAVRQGFMQAARVHSWPDEGLKGMEARAGPRSIAHCAHQARVKGQRARALRSALLGRTPLRPAPLNWLLPGGMAAVAPHCTGCSLPRHARPLRSRVQAQAQVAPPAGGRALQRLGGPRPQLPQQQRSEQGLGQQEQRRQGGAHEVRDGGRACAIDARALVGSGTQSRRCIWHCIAPACIPGIQASPSPAARRAASPRPPLAPRRPRRRWGWAACWPRRGPRAPASC